MIKKLGRFDRPIALLLGVLTTLGFQPINFWPASLIGLAGLMMLCQDRDWKRAALLGWLFGFAHFASGVYWVVVSTHVYGGAPLWLGLLLAAVLFAYMAVYPALVCGIASYRRAWRSRFGWLLVPCLWTLGELLRGWVMTGFPWLALGYVWLDTPMQSLAPIVGVHGISLLLVVSAFGLYRFVGASGGSRLFASVLAISPALSLALPGPEHWTRASEQFLDVAIVQGNVPQDEKWDAGRGPQILSRYREMSLSAADADLVAWPEVVPNAPLRQVRPYLDELHAQFALRDSTLLAGVLIFGEQQQIYNSMLALGANRGRYDKRHLVPFGEYFPIPDWLRPLMDVLGTPYSDFSSGDADYDPIQVRSVQLGISICFEDVFAAEFARESNNAGILVNATNDAWFAGTSAPSQHLGIARMRAMENGRWLVRATNTGYSALIDHAGAVVAQTPWGEAYVLRGRAQERLGRTPYAVWRDLPLWLLGVLALLLLFGMRQTARPKTR